MRTTLALAAGLALASSSPARAQSCDFGPDTCLPGFVWREASPADHVCVTGATRAQAANDNALAAQRRSPTGGPFGPDTCLQGFVWRDAFPGDHVCVDGATRDQAAADNAQAAARRDPACAAPPPDPSPPAIVETTLRFYQVPTGAEVGSTVVPAAGITVPNVPRDRRFVITSIARDDQSGVSTLRGQIEAKWTCTSVINPVAAAKNLAYAGLSDEEMSGTAAPGSPQARNAHFSIDPFDGNPLRLVCPSTNDANALTVDATLVATNGQGRATSPGPIVVVYAPRPHTGLAAGAVCGDKARGVVSVCTTGTTCDFRRDRVCSGWFIFRHCDYITSVDMFCQ